MRLNRHKKIIKKQPITILSIKFKQPLSSANVHYNSGFSCNKHTKKIVLLHETQSDFNLIFQSFRYALFSFISRTYHSFTPLKTKALLAAIAGAKD